MCSAVPRGGRRTGADPVPARTRSRSRRRSDTSAANSAFGPQSMIGSASKQMPDDARRRIRLVNRSELFTPGALGGSVKRSIEPHWWRGLRSTARIPRKSSVAIDTSALPFLAAALRRHLEQFSLCRQRTIPNRAAGSFSHLSSVTLTRNANLYMCGSGLLRDDAPVRTESTCCGSQLSRQKRRASQVFTASN
jgi:hypothetical protein